MMAGLLAKALRYLDLKVHDLIEGMGDHLDQIAMIGPKDLAIIISLPRYTAQVVDAAKYLHKAGVPVVLITDTGLSPAHPYADLSFHCTMTSSYYFPSFFRRRVSFFRRSAGVPENDGKRSSLSSVVPRYGFPPTLFSSCGISHESSITKYRSPRIDGYSPAQLQNSPSPNMFSSFMAYRIISLLA